MTPPEWRRIIRITCWRGILRVVDSLSTFWIYYQNGAKSTESRNNYVTLSAKFPQRGQPARHRMLNQRVDIRFLEDIPSTNRCHYACHSCLYDETNKKKPFFVGSVYEVNLRSERLKLMATQNATVTNIFFKFHNQSRK